MREWEKKQAYDSKNRMGFMPCLYIKTRVQIREDIELKNLSFIVQNVDRKLLSERQMQDQSLLTLNFQVAGFSAY